MSNISNHTSTKQSSEKFFGSETPIKRRYETKFSVLDLNHNEIENIIKSHPAIFNEIYFTRNVNNIYFDTVDFSSFIDNIEGVRDRKKVRIRWYEYSI